MVHYVGISKPEEFPEDPLSYKQKALIKRLVVPSEKPDIEEVIKIMAKIKIQETKVIENPYDIKLLVSGIVKQRIIYTANTTQQPVHSFHSIIPFCELVIMEKFNCNHEHLKVKALIEDIHLFNTELRAIEECKTLCFTVEEEIFCS